MGSMTTLLIADATESAASCWPQTARAIADLLAALPALAMPALTTKTESGVTFAAPADWKTLVTAADHGVTISRDAFTSFDVHWYDYKSNRTLDQLLDLVVKVGRGGRVGQRGLAVSRQKRGGRLDEVERRLAARGPHLAGVGCVVAPDAQDAADREAVVRALNRDRRWGDDGRRGRGHPISSAWGSTGKAQG